MKKHIMNNFGLKIVSVLLAIFTWLLVVNIDNPTQTRTFENVAVKVQNGSYIESMEKSYRIETGKNLVNVVVTGKRSVVEKLTVDDIAVTADLTQIISLDSDPVMVPITATCKSNAISSITTKPQAIQIVIEKLVSSDFIITPSSSDTKPGKGYEIGNMEVTPEKVTIIGPESTISKIDKVVASVDVTNITENKNIMSSLKIVDKNQDVMSDSDTQYLRFKDLTENQVSVSVTLWKVLSDVKIDVSYSGQPEKGYRVSSVTTTPSVLSVYGDNEALQELSEVGDAIEIPKSEINVEGKSSDFEKKVDITKYLPEGIKLASDVSVNVLVKVSILPEDSQEFTISTSAIQVLNKASDLGVLYNADKITVRVKGLDETLSDLNVSDIQASIDLSGKTEGQYEMPVNITLPSGLELVESVTVALQLEKIVDNTE